MPVCCSTALKQFRDQGIHTEVETKGVFYRHSTCDLKPKSKPQAEHKEQSEAILKKAYKVNRGVWSCHFFFKSLPSLPRTTEFKRPWGFFGVGLVFFQPLAQQFTLLPSHEEKKVREKLFKPAHHQQNRHYRQQSQSEASKGVVCPGGAGTVQSREKGFTCYLAERN